MFGMPSYYNMGYGTLGYPGWGYGQYPLYGSSYGLGMSQYPYYQSSSLWRYRYWQY